MAISISQNAIHSILKAYNITDKIVNVCPAQTGYRNTIFPLKLAANKKLALVVFKQEPKIIKRIRCSNDITQFLSKRGWPVRVTLTNQNDQSILKVSKNNKSRYVCVYNYLPGHTINWEGYTKKHIKLLGQVLGFLHQDLASFDKTANIFQQKEVLILKDLLLEMNTYFNNKFVQQALKTKLKLNPNKTAWPYFKTLLTKLADIKNQQWLHLDFVRSNLLFQTLSKQQIADPRFAFDADQTDKNQILTISGVLDFEKAAFGPKVIDLARTLAFLLVDCKYKTSTQVRKYFLHSGYEKRGKNKIVYPELLDPLTSFFLFYDFYKFLLHNPYESLEGNEHYVRTKQYLLKIGLLKKSA
jgi:Ser/Thr protein kinase RdoA (MazF antagonist)